MMKTRQALPLILTLCLTACGQEAQTDKNNAAPIECSDGERYNEIKGACEPFGNPNDMAQVVDMPTTPDMTPDMTTQPDMPPAPDMTMAPDMAPDMMVMPDMEQPAGGTLVGKITRSTEPKSGGKGGLYVAIFERNPITDMNNPGLVARTFIPNADMSAAGASYDYTLGPIPPRAEAYYITAFLDDNNTVDMNDPSNAGPDRGDLVSLNGFSFPTVMVTQPSQQTLNLVLNTALPF